MLANPATIFQKCETDMENPTMADMMTQLYGEDMAHVVFTRCRDLDVFFNYYVQTSIYGKMWALPGLSLMDKSICTISALVALGMEEQLGIHLTGFFHIKGDENVLREVFERLCEQSYVSSLDMFNETLEMTKRSLSSEPQSFPIIPETLMNLVSVAKLASKIANASSDDIRSEVRELRDAGVLSDHDLKGVAKHLYAYCGYPKMMQALTIINEIYEVDADDDFMAFFKAHVFAPIWENVQLSSVEKNLIAIVSTLALKEDDDVLDEVLQRVVTGQLDGALNDSGFAVAGSDFLFMPDRVKTLVFESEQQEKPDSEGLSVRMRSMMKIVIACAHGDNDVTKSQLEEVISEDELNEDDIRSIMRLQMFYCGCPAGMNGFTKLNEVMAQRNQLRNG